VPIAEPIRDALPDGLKRYLPSRQERGKYTGPLSTFAEYHAVGVGFAAGVEPSLLEPVAGYAAGTGAGKCRRSGHLSDAAKELGYTGLGVGLAVGMRALGLL